MAKVLLLIAQEGFQTKEYHDPKRVLEDAGHSVITASVDGGVATSSAGDKTFVDLKLREVKIGDYDAIGGPGAPKFLDNDETARIMTEALAREDVPYGAICISPRILAKAGVIHGKKVTGWDNDGKLGEVFEDAGAIYEHAPVVVDGRVVTADGPGSAEDFGKAIAKLLK
jgi:putative intracellular protease/amidase